MWEFDTNYFRYSEGLIKKSSLSSISWDPEVKGYTRSRSPVTPSEIIQIVIMNNLQTDGINSNNS